MSDKQTDKFFIELGAVFDPKGFNEAEDKAQQTTGSINKSFETLGSKTAKYGADMTRVINAASKASSAGFKNFFDKSSSGFMNLEGVAKGVFSSILQSFTSMITQMLATSVIKGAAGLMGGGAGFLGGLLGSRKVGGPIGQTGPYLLHEGEYVLPSDVVSSIKQGSAPASGRATGAALGGSINLTVNTPVTVNSSGGEIDAKRLAQEVSDAARRGAAWAIEHAKINYKIGKQRSGESSI